MLQFLGLAGIILYAGYKYLSSEEKNKVEELLKKKSYSKEDLDIVKIIKDKIKEAEDKRNKKSDEEKDINVGNLKREFLSKEEIDNLLDIAENNDFNEKKEQGSIKNNFLRDIILANLNKDNSNLQDELNRLLNQEKKEIKEDLSNLKKDIYLNIEDIKNIFKNFQSEKIEPMLAKVDTEIKNSNIEENLKKVADILNQYSKKEVKEDDSINELEKLKEERTYYQKELARAHELTLLNSRLTVSGNLNNSELSIDGMDINTFLKETEIKLNNCTKKINELQK